MSDSISLQAGYRKWVVKTTYWKLKMFLQFLNHYFFFKEQQFHHSPNTETRNKFSKANDMQMGGHNERESTSMYCVHHHI